MTYFWCLKPCCHFVMKFAFTFDRSLLIHKLACWEKQSGSYAANQLPLIVIWPSEFFRILLSVFKCRCSHNVKLLNQLTHIPRCIFSFLVAINMYAKAMLFVLIPRTLNDAPILWLVDAIPMLHIVHELAYVASSIWPEHLSKPIHSIILKFSSVFFTIFPFETPEALNHTILPHASVSITFRKLNATEPWFLTILKIPMIFIAFFIALKAEAFPLVAVKCANEKCSIFRQLARSVNYVVVELAFKGVACSLVMKFSCTMCSS